MKARNGIDLSRLSALALAALLAAGLGGCSGDDGDDGADGADGAAGAPGTDGADGADGADGQDGTDAAAVVRGLTRLAATPLGSEITGLYIGPDGDLFFNVQHPADSNSATDTNGTTYNLGTVGVVENMNINALPRQFQGLPVPETPTGKQLVNVAAGSYRAIAQEGQSFGGGDIIGEMTDSSGNRVKLSNDPDFNAFVPTGANEGYLFSNWEDRPGGMSRIRVQKDPSTGVWSVMNNDAAMVDFRGVNGTWVNCFGTVSPWGTPLTSEELYFDDTSQWNNPGYNYIGDVEDLATYLDDTYPNPYDYGYIVELTNPDDADVANVVPNKLETLGRFSHENSVVMPDEKTVFLSDDGTGVVFFKFVADTAGDLSAGTIYAAQATQTGTSNNPAYAGFDLTWIALGSGDEATLEAAIRDYDGIDQSDYTDGATSYISDEQVCDYAESVAGSDLACDTDTTADSNPFSDNRVAFLESRKVAAALGATAEFRKMEGVNINLGRAETLSEDGDPDTTAYMYMAMSEVNATMSDSDGDIQLTANDCGVVYQMPLEYDAGTDSYDVSSMVPAVAGGPYDGGATVNQCNVHNISNPDNVIVLDDGRVLIGEDTGEHENNMLWVFDPEA